MAERSPAEDFTAWSAEIMSPMLVSIDLKHTFNALDHLVHVKNLRQHSAEEVIELLYFSRSNTPVSMKVRKLGSGMLEMTFDGDEPGKHRAPEKLTASITPTFQTPPMASDGLFMIHAIKHGMAMAELGDGNIMLHPMIDEK